jgi:hypothetical protein
MKKKNKYKVVVESTIIRVYSVFADSEIQAEESVLSGEYDEIIDVDECDSEVTNTKKL